MKKVIVVGMLAVLLLVVTTPASAQEEEATSGVIGGTASVGPRQSESPPVSDIPDYRFVDGEVLIGGDIAMDCTAFAASIEEERTPAGDIPAGALDALDGCVEAGLLPSSLAVSGASAGGAELPETGGPPLPTLPGASAALLTAGVLVVARNVGGWVGARRGRFRHVLPK